MMIKYTMGIYLKKKAVSIEAASYVLLYHQALQQLFGIR